MDKTKADWVKSTADTSASDTAAFACGTLSTSDTLWMGLVYGYLEYPYPCQGSANILLQLRDGSDVVAEHQALVSQNIHWSGTMPYIQATQQSYGSRLAVYGNNGKTAQLWFEEVAEEGMSFYMFKDRATRRRTRTVNVVERLNEEIRRRTKVARLFPNGASCNRLVTAVLMQMHEKWVSEKIYINPAKMELAKNYRKDVA